MVVAACVVRWAVVAGGGGGGMCGELSGGILVELSVGMVSGADLVMNCTMVRYSVVNDDDMDGGATIIMN